MHAALELQAALYAALGIDPELADLLGGNKIYDDLPAGLRPPFVRFGQAVHTDWNTATESGAEHRINLEAWSSHDGRKQVTQIADRLRIVALALSVDTPNTSLVNLEHLSTDIRRDAKTDWFRAVVSLRAVTETPPL